MHVWTCASSVLHWNTILSRTHSYTPHTHALTHSHTCTLAHSHTHTYTELPSRMLLDAAVQRVLSEHSYAQLPLNKRYCMTYLCLFLYLNINIQLVYRCTCVSWLLSFGYSWLDMHLVLSCLTLNMEPPWRAFFFVVNPLHIFMPARPYSPLHFSYKAMIWREGQGSSWPD